MAAAASGGSPAVIGGTLDRPRRTAPSRRPARRPPLLVSLLVGALVLPVAVTVPSGASTGSHDADRPPAGADATSTTTAGPGPTTAAPATGGAGPDLTVAVHVARCPSVDVVVGNHDAHIAPIEGIDPDALATPWLAEDAPAVDGSIPDGCDAASGWGLRVAVDRAMTSIVRDHHAGDGGTLTIDATRLDTAHRSVLERGGRLWVAPIAPEGQQLVAFRCQDDATNGDAVEYLHASGGPIAHCVIYAVDAAAADDADGGAVEPPPARPTGDGAGDGAGDGPGSSPDDGSNDDASTDGAPNDGPSTDDAPTDGASTEEVAPGDRPADPSDGPSPDGPSPGGVGSAATDAGPPPTSAPIAPGDGTERALAPPAARVGHLSVRVEVGGVTTGDDGDPVRSPWTQRVRVVVGCDGAEPVEVGLAPGAVPGTASAADVEVPLGNAPARTCDVVTVEDGVHPDGVAGGVQVLADGAALDEGEVLPVTVTEADAAVTLALTYAVEERPPELERPAPAPPSSDPPVLAAADPGRGSDPGVSGGAPWDVLVLSLVFATGLALTAQRSRRPL
ncbi:MAG: hypothetical protein S0880_25800 [Actinomycetota bacterium]|nr:hypothetical protein [Actinomycetota bacterium]